MQRLVRRVKTLLRRRQLEQDLQSELVAHLAMDAQERIEAGEPPETARQAARRDLGNLARVTEDTRATWGWTGVEHVLQDLRYAGRQLRRRPGFAAVVIATLAVGIGATTAVFSVLQAVVLAPLPYEQPGQLVRLYQQEPDKPATRHYLTGAHFSFLRDHATSFEVVAALDNYSETGHDLVRDGRGERLRVLPVTSDYFQTLRSGALRGPGFDRSDEIGTRRVVISDALWRARFNADSSIVGSTIRLSGEPYEVVGIAPERLRRSDRRRIRCLARLRPRPGYERAKQLVDRRRAAAKRDRSRAGSGRALEPEPGDEGPFSNRALECD